MSGQWKFVTCFDKSLCEGYHVTVLYQEMKGQTREKNAGNQTMESDHLRKEEIQDFRGVQYHANNDYKTLDRKTQSIFVCTLQNRI